MSSFWQREPAALVGQVQAVLGICASAGLAISDHTTAAIVAAATVAANLLALILVRSQVTSPAHAQQLQQTAAEATDAAGNAQGVAAMYQLAGTPEDEQPAPGSLEEPVDRSTGRPRFHAEAEPEPVKAVAKKAAPRKRATKAVKES